MTIDSNIEQLFEISADAAARAREQASRISYASPAFTIPNSGFDPDRPSINRPQPLSDFIGVNNDPARAAWLNGEADKWLNKYFPNTASALNSSPEQWFSEILTGKDADGNPTKYGRYDHVFERVWAAARDREYRSRNSAVNQIASDFSSRGFTVPQGAMISAITQLENETANAIGRVNIEQAFKDAEIHKEILLFASDQAIRMRLGILGELAGFYRMWIELPDKTLDESKLKVDAYNSLNNALSDYYKVELGWEELRMAAEKLRIDGKLDTARLKVQAATGDNRNGAIGQAVKAFADIAASSANAAGTLQANIVTG